MASAVNFDPSTAKPVQAFDPSTAKLVKNATTESKKNVDDVLGSVTSTSMAVQRGLLGGVLGGPGELERMMPSINWISDIFPSAGKYLPHIPNVLPNISQAERILGGKAVARAHPTAQRIGELLSAAVPVGVGTKAIADASKATEIASHIVPGATRRAEEKILSLGPSLDKDAIGRGVLSSLRPDYDALYAERKLLLDKVANDMEEGPQKTAAFRKIYQDPKFSEIKRIEENPLGAKVIATTTRYSSTPKINPKDFLKQAFRSPQDVRDLKSLFNGDQNAVEKVATRYVASDLKSVMDQARTASATEANPFKSEAGNIAASLERWRVKNSDWLKEVPQTKKAVDTFVDNMVAVAKTQKHFKYALAAGATLGMFEGGFHPFSWLSRLFGGVE